MQSLARLAQKLAISNVLFGLVNPICSYWPYPILLFVVTFALTLHYQVSDPIESLHLIQDCYTERFVKINPNKSYFKGKHHSNLNLDFKPNQILKTFFLRL